MKQNVDNDLVHYSQETSPLKANNFETLIIQLNKDYSIDSLNNIGGKDFIVSRKEQGVMTLKAT